MTQGWYRTRPERGIGPECGVCSRLTPVPGVSSSSATHTLRNVSTPLMHDPPSLSAQMAKRLLGRHWQSCLSPPPDLTGMVVLSLQDWHQRASVAQGGGA